MTKRQRIIIVIFVLIFGFLTFFSYCWSHQSVSVLQKRQQSRMSPVIMIPGSSATVNRFDTLVARINQMDHQSHSLLKVKVYNSGKITYSG